MGAPGTLIPADALSGKDTPLKPYNLEPSRLPNFQPTEGTKVTSTLTAPNLGATSWKPETPLSLVDSSADDGVGTSGLHDNVPSVNQLDRSSSQAIGSSLYKEGRGPNLVGDGVRMNVNVVPYNPKSPQDPKDLFSELNPFQIKGSGKNVVNNDFPNEVGKLQFPKNNIVSSRPPAPLMWKNRHAWNEVPKENEQGFPKGSFVNNNQGSNKGNVLSVVSNSSKPPSKAPKFPEKSFNNFVEKRDSTQSNNVKFAAGESVPRLPFGQDFKFNDGEREQGNIIKHEAPNQEDYGLREDKRNTRDRLLVTNTKRMETDGASSSLVLRGNNVDTEIDDVGECEIVWEDLDLGERIGLGNQITCYFYHFSYVQTSHMFCMSELGRWLMYSMYPCLHRVSFVIGLQSNFCLINNL